MTQGPYLLSAIRREIAHLQHVVADVERDRVPGAVVTNLEAAIEDLADAAAVLDHSLAGITHA